jgi:hypothetical protein
MLVIARVVSDSTLFLVEFAAKRTHSVFVRSPAFSLWCTSTSSVLILLHANWPIPLELVLVLATISAGSHVSTS